MFTITSIVIVTLIKNVGKPTFIFTDFLHFILPFTYGVKIYNFNFNQVLALMEKFKSPGERKKEQDFYVFKEFEQFLSGEDDPRFIILWKTLY